RANLCERELTCEASRPQRGPWLLQRQDRQPGVEPELQAWSVEQGRPDAEPEEPDDARREPAQPEREEDSARLPRDCSLPSGLPRRSSLPSGLPRPEDRRTAALQPKLHRRAARRD